jgi:hypothetical protein
VCERERGREFHDGKLHNLYPSPDMIKVIKIKEVEHMSTN